uniref:(northern house mosquito) hypothetical protein n=1 Tax=Culex pipiens TaxID=7175 RepID=A0A8D8E0D9_CULPI
MVTAWEIRRHSETGPRADRFREIYSWERPRRMRFGIWGTWRTTVDSMGASARLNQMQRDGEERRLWEWMRVKNTSPSSTPRSAQFRPPATLANPSTPHPGLTLARPPSALPSAEVNRQINSTPAPRSTAPRAARPATHATRGPRSPNARPPAVTVTVLGMTHAAVTTVPATGRPAHLVWVTLLRTRR